jgi:membrane protein insertase Oxa1/YidC/SpoIIIJ
MQRRHASWTGWFSGGGSASGSAPAASAAPAAAQPAAAPLPHVFDEQPAAQLVQPSRGFYERMEDGWEWITTFSPIDMQCSVLRSIHDSGFLGLTGPLEWGVVFVLWGVLMRLLSLGPMLYAHRNTLRMNRISPQVNEITQKMRAIKSDRSLSSAERKVMKAGYKRLQAALYAKNNCSSTKTFASAATSPFMMSAFVSIRRMASYDESLETSKFLWVTDLTMPDPTYLLPLACTSMFLVNYELNQALQRGGRSSTSLYIRWGLRGGSLIFVYFFAAQPSAIFAYWIGMSLAGTLQPILLRWQAFRDYFDFPPPPKASTQHTTLLDKAMLFMRGGETTQTLAVAQAAEEARGATVMGAGGVPLRKIQEEEVVFDSGAATGSEYDELGLKAKSAPQWK